MALNRSAEYIVELVRELSKFAMESEWVEFRVSSHQPQEIGQFRSAYVSSATSTSNPHGYVSWSISDLELDHRSSAPASTGLTRRSATKS